MVIPCVGLARLWYLVAWSNTSLKVFILRYDQANIQMSRLSETDYSL